MRYFSRTRNEIGIFWGIHCILSNKKKSGKIGLSGK